MKRDYALNFKIISDSVNKWLSARARAYGITPTQGRVLVYLHENRDKKITQRDIERHLGCSHTTVSGIIMRMKMKGLIRVTSDASDGRAKNIVISDKYNASFDGKLHAEADKIDDYLLVGFTDEEKRIFSELIGRVTDNVTTSNKLFQKEKDL